MPTPLPSMNPLKTQPYRRSPPRSLATTGITVTTASASEATKVIVSTRPVVSARRCGAHSPPPTPVLSAAAVDAPPVEDASRAGHDGGQPGHEEQRVLESGGASAAGDRGGGRDLGHGLGRSRGRSRGGGRGRGDRDRRGDRGGGLLRHGLRGVRRRGLGAAVGGRGARVTRGSGDRYRAADGHGRREAGNGGRRG